MRVIIFLICCTIGVVNAWLFSSDNNGVTASKLIRTARKYDGSTDWNLAGCKHGSKYCGENKCNLFVHDMLVEAGAVVPKRRWLVYSPIGANEWGKSKSSYILKTKCYKNVNQRRAGDIVAFPNNAGHGHVGIVTYGGKYISAGPNKVVEKGIPNKSMTIWRYLYSKNGC